MDLLRLLPYLGAGSSATIPFVLWRLMNLESLIKNQEQMLKKERKRNDLIYFYLAKKDTHFGDFLNKHNANF